MCVCMCMCVCVLARLLSWLECHPINQKVAGLIPGQGTYLGCAFSAMSGCMWEAVNRCFSHIDVSLSLSLSLSPHLPLSPTIFLSKINKKHILEWRFKKRERERFCV